jgi:hypothetical protein
MVNRETKRQTVKVAWNMAAILALVAALVASAAELVGPLQSDWSDAPPVRTR